MALIATIKASIAARLTGSNDMTPVPTHDFVEAFDKLFEDGSGANQASNCWSDERTLTASASEELDLYGGLTNALGATLNFTEIKAIMLLASASNTNDVILGNAAATVFVGPFGAAAHTVAARPGGLVMFVNPAAAGWAVANGSTDKLKVANSAGSTSVTYRIVIIGEA